MFTKLFKCLLKCFRDFINKCQNINVKVYRCARFMEVTPVKRKNFFLLFASVITSAVLVSVISVRHNKSSVNVVKGDPVEYSITLDSSNSASSLSGDYQGSVSGTVYTKGDYSLSLKYLTAKKEAGSHVTLCSRSKLYNEPNASTYNNRVTGLRSITVNFSGGALNLKTSITNDGLEYGPKQSLTSGQSASFEDFPYYFMLETEDSPVVIQSIVLNYSCSTNAGYYINELAGTYTGNDGEKSYKLVIDGSSSRIDGILTEPAYSKTNLVPTLTNNSLTLSNGEFTYTATVSADHSKLTAVSGNLTVDFYKVYKVEDFESYASTGVGYDNKDHTSWYNVTGLRSQIYAQYDGADRTDKYSRMGNTDWVTLTPNGYGHSGKAMLMKASNNYMRYIQSKLYYGDTSLAGRGTKLSFWAYGALTGTSTTTQGTTDIDVEVFGFHKASGRIKENADIANSEYHTVGVVTVPKQTGWTRYEIDLDPSKNYTGYGFKLRPTGGSTVYLPVDDIEIFRDSPYEAYVSAIPVDGVTLDKDSLIIEAGKSKTLVATVSPNDATNKNVVWTTSNENVATVVDGVVTGVNAGNATITATTEEGGFHDECSITVDEPYEYPSGTFTGTATLEYLNQTGNYPVFIASGDQGYVEFAFAGVTIDAFDYRYNTSTHVFTLKSNKPAEVQVGNTTYYIKVAINSLSGIIEDGTFKNITFGNDCTICYKNGAEGEYGSTSDLSTIVTNNGSISLTKQVTGASAFTYDCEGSTEEMQSMFKRRYRAWGNTPQPWKIDDVGGDATNTDRVKKDSTHFVDGTSGMSFRGYSSGEAALTLKNELGTGSGTSAYNNISFWVYYHGNTAKTISLFTFSATDFGGSDQIGSYTLQPGEWKFVTCGYKGTIYNFQVFISGAPQLALTFDSLCLFHS